MESNNDKNLMMKICKDFLEKEIEALNNLYNKFPEEIIEACKLILDCKGYIIVSGIGKSGHIGNKISATLSSTGTPSFFIHPSEASHGDLGMIKNNCIIIAISNSGESKELFDLLEYSKKIGVKIIGITSNKNSTLARFSDILLAYPFEEEACFMNLVPTSSTMMTLALGDTLAVLLYKMRNFNHHSFKELHPGGKLGKKLLTAKNIMRDLREIAIVDEKAKFKDVILKISNSIGGYCFIVGENLILKGIITDGDIRRNILKYTIDEPVQSFMSTKNIKYCLESTFVAEILHIMSENRIMALPVIEILNEEKYLKGMVHIHDVNKVV